MVAMEKPDSAAPAEQRVATIPIHVWIIGEGLRGQPLNALLAAASFHAGAGPLQGRLKSMGRRALRGVRDPVEIFMLTG